MLHLSDPYLFGDRLGSANLRSSKLLLTPLVCLVSLCWVHNSLLKISSGCRALKTVFRISVRRHKLHVTNPFCLFLDELNACSQEVQKAFYSLINDRRIGEYELPAGSVVIGAGNRAQDAAIVKPLSSALINRMIHVELRANATDWLDWAGQVGVHRLVQDYIRLRSDHLWAKPQKHEEPFSTPRAWHVLSDAFASYGDQALTADIVNVLASGLLTPAHARQFLAFYKQQLSAFDLKAIIKGEMSWPEQPEERDVLYFLVQSFRAQLIKELPKDQKKVAGEAKSLALAGKDRLLQLSRISLEMAQLVIAEDDDGTALPDWYMIELARDLPRLMSKRDG